MRKRLEQIEHLAINLEQRVAPNPPSLNNDINEFFDIDSAHNMQEAPNQLVLLNTENVNPPSANNGQEAPKEPVLLNNNDDTLSNPANF